MYAFWNKSVDFLDVPVFPGITGPKLSQALVAWMGAQPGHVVTISGVSRHTGIWRRAGMVLRVTRGEAPDGATAPAGYLFEIEASTKALKPGVPLTYGQSITDACVNWSTTETMLDELAAALDPTDARALAAAPLPLARRAVRRWLTCEHPPDLATVDRVLQVARGGQFPEIRTRSTLKALDKLAADCK